MDLYLALLQSPVSSVASVNERTPVQSSRRKLFSVSDQQSPGNASTPVVKTTAPPLALIEQENEQKSEILPSPTPSMATADNKPKRTGSLSLFFRKVRLIV